MQYPKIPRNREKLFAEFRRMHRKYGEPEAIVILPNLSTDAMLMLDVCFSYDRNEPGGVSVTLPVYHADLHWYNECEEEREYDYSNQGREESTLIKYNFDWLENQAHEEQLEFLKALCNPRLK